MVKKVYTEEQRKILIGNKNVLDCGKGVITYTTDFKIKAVKQYQQRYMKPQDIFIQAGFDLDMIGRKKPKDCLLRWNKTYKEKGFSGLSESFKNRGRPKKTKDKTDEGKIKRLELEIEYLKAENDFLAKLRAKRMRNSNHVRNIK